LKTFDIAIWGKLPPSTFLPRQSHLLPNQSKDLWTKQIWCLPAGYSKSSCSGSSDFNCLSTQIW